MEIKTGLDFSAAASYQSTPRKEEGKHFIRRTFLLSEQADRALIRVISLNKLQDRKPTSVSALLREIVEEHISLGEEERLEFYKRYNPLSFNVTLSGGGGEIRTLDDYRKRRADKTNRTVTLVPRQLSVIERFAAKNRYDNVGPQTVNALLLHLVNEYIGGCHLP
ncbi:hypothetical protein [Klebsiella aerogenes]|uniref:hypothetical protein n=1 Tax=Klebsiella aerogenes TaxID=548 RepID=UPI001F2DDB2B|nr:hypothetical protein [Klebsiella aerogenes]